MEPVDPADELCDIALQFTSRVAGFSIPTREIIRVQTVDS